MKLLAHWGRWSHWSRRTRCGGIAASFSLLLGGVLAQALADLNDLKKLAIENALKRHGLDPKSLSASVLQGQIKKMRQQLQFDCRPVRARMGALLDTAVLYRDFVLFELKNHAKDQSALATARSRFAVPPSKFGAGIPAEAAAELRACLRRAYGHRRINVAAAAIMMRVSAIRGSCS